MLKSKLHEYEQQVIKYTKIYDKLLNDMGKYQYLGSNKTEQGIKYYKDMIEIYKDKIYQYKLNLITKRL